MKERIERDLAAGKFQVEHRDTPIDAFWPEYLTWAQAHKRRFTIESEKLFWRQFTSFAKPQKLGDVDRSDVEKFKVMRRTRIRA